MAITNLFPAVFPLKVALGAFDMQVVVENLETVELWVLEGWQVLGLRELAAQKRKPSCRQTQTMTIPESV